jgi:hypothetical protein
MKLNPNGFKLSHHQWTRRSFDPNKVEDLKEYHHFLKYSRWENGCPFIIEWPFLNVADMISNRIIHGYIDSIIETTEAGKRQNSRRETVAE